MSDTAAITRRRPTPDFVRIGGAVLLALCFVATFTFRLDAELGRAAEPIPPRDITSHNLPSGPALRLLALGHREAVADLLWLNALSRFGDTHGLSRDPSWLDAHIESVIAVDPRFRIVYIWAGVVVMYGSTINNSSVALSSRYLERGLERFPSDPEILAMLAMNYLFEYKPNGSEETERIHAKGRAYLARAAEAPGSSSMIRLAAASHARREGNLERAVDVAMQSYLATTEIADARSLRIQLEALLAGAEADAALRMRPLSLRFREDPRWGALRSDTALLLHPEPAYLYPPELIAPPPLELVR